MLAFALVFPVQRPLPDFFSRKLPTCKGNYSNLLSERRQIRFDMMAEGAHGSAAPGTDAGAKNLYKPFWEYTKNCLESRFAGDLFSYPIPEGFSVKEERTSQNGRANPVTTRSFAFASSVTRQIRGMHLQAGADLQLFNLMIFPELDFDLPFFSADLVTLGGSHLVALDMLPLFNSDSYRAKYRRGFTDIYDKYKEGLSLGSDLPAVAVATHSPFLLWCRPADDADMSTLVFEAFKEYLNVYIDFVRKAAPVQDEVYLNDIMRSQLAFTQHRAKKDPARALLSRFYGDQWTENYFRSFLYDLESKLSSMDSRTSAL